MKILKPDWARGNLLLTYNGGSLNYENKSKLTIIDLHRNKNIDGIIHPIIIEAKLFDKSNIILSLTEPEIYEYKDGNHIDNPGLFYLDEILINADIVIIKGKIEFCKTVAENQYYMEKYDLEFITKTRDEIIVELQRANIEYKSF